MSSKTVANYKQSLRDLQEVNDALFYDDLKNQMNIHLARLEDEFQKVEKSAEYVSRSMAQIEHSFQATSQQATAEMRIAAKNADEVIQTVLSEETVKLMTKLNQVYVAFQQIGEQQKHFVEEHFIKQVEQNIADMNGKLSSTLTAYQASITNMHEQLTNLVENQQAEIEKREANWKQLANDIDAKYEERLKTFEVASTLQFKDIQHVLTGVQQINKELISEQTKQQTKATAQFEHLEQVVEQTQSKQELAIIKQNEVQDTQVGNFVLMQREQHEQLQQLLSMQAEQGKSMRKWLITLSIVQGITVAVGTGLYFF
ncbi:hypothetical protein [Paenisporosarcina sp. NPDC076898]|uniref:hypothetical protein n=1 Tax=unclassified Paenisporosarcina TaxID=2642018 RepID=UPI003CFD8D43